MSRASIALCVLAACAKTPAPSPAPPAIASAPTDAGAVPAKPTVSAIAACPAGAPPIVARVDPEVILPCYPASVRECKRSAPIRFANCSKDPLRVTLLERTNDRRDANATHAFDHDLAPGASEVMPVPILRDGVHRFRVVARTEDGALPIDPFDVTFDVRDPARERARATYCADLGDAGASDAAAPPLPPNGVEITLRRTACYGSCPVYTVSLRTDGTVIYEGQSFVRAPGRFVGNVATAGVTDLVARFDAALASADRSRHCVSPPDAPKALISLKRGKTTTDLPMIANCHPTPDKDLAVAIDRVAGTERWVTGGDECASRELW